MFTPDEVSRLARGLDALPHRSRAGARHLMSASAVTDVAHDPRLLALAREAIGPTAAPYRATLFAKSREANWLVVWHQDTALPLRRRVDVPGWGPWSTKCGVVYAHAPAHALEAVVALRVHLDDSGHENGPLRVLPGSHRSGVLTDAAILDLAGRVRPQECLVGRGGVVLMRPLLVHASSKSTARMPRRVLHIEYTSTVQFPGGLELDIA